MDLDVVSLDEALRILSAKGGLSYRGFGETWGFARRAIGRNGIRQSDLNSLVNFAKSIGEENFTGFIQRVHLIEFFDKEAKLSNSKKIILAVKRFGPIITDITNHPLFKHNGIEPLIFDGERPFNFRLLLKFQNKTSFCDLSFSLKNSLQGRALVTIGNFHGSHTAVLTELERKTKTRMFDFLIQEFIKSSSAHNAKIYASAPSEHHAYQSPSLAAVLHKLKIAKKATNIEIARYANSKRYFNRLEQLGQLSKLDYIQAVALFKQRDTKRIKQIDALVRKEIKRVQIRGTVSHKIAFKKAGFRVKEKMWGIVGKTPDGVLITRPTKMSPPRFRLDPRRFGVKR